MAKNYKVVTIKCPTCNTETKMTISDFNTSPIMVKCDVVNCDAHYIVKIKYEATPMMYKIIRVEE